MDYGNLKEALELISKTCREVGDCGICPFGNNDEDCLIQRQPDEWDIPKTQIIRLLK